MRKLTAKPPGYYLTHLTPKGKSKVAMKMAAGYRQRGMTPKQALKKAWGELRRGGYLDK